MWSAYRERTSPESIPGTWPLQGFPALVQTALLWSSYPVRAGRAWHKPLMKLTRNGGHETPSANCARPPGLTLRHYPLLSRHAIAVHGGAPDLRNPMLLGHV